ncbi:MAG: RNA polymerase sigma factor, partial [Lachnospiraceae bacterium]|nr:RNA polymerase sigma factor [Lachnospiraceae bacterium]
DGDCKVISWLCQIAKNTYISYLRKEKRLVNSEDIEQLIENMAGTESSLQEKVEDAEIAGDIRSIMNSLEPPYDEVFRMKVEEEKSYQEIGAFYGKSENWARVTYFRAKQKIVERLKKEGKYE